MSTIRSVPRLGELYRHGSRYVQRERGGEWGLAGPTLDGLLLRLRGEPWNLSRIFRLTEHGPVPVSTTEVVKSYERLVESGYRMTPTETTSA